MNKRWLWSRPVRWLVGQIFAQLHFALPVALLQETKTLIAFRHPRPAYPVHILLVPKRAIATFEQLDIAGDEFASRFLVDLVACVQNLAAELRLNETGYRLIVNGGCYQDFPQLHFHLISGEPAKGSGRTA